MLEENSAQLTFRQPFEYDFCEAAYEVGGKASTLVDAWSGDHMGFYSSLAAVNRTTDPGRRSYAATGYLLPNIGRSNLKVLAEAMATKITLDGDIATGIEFFHSGGKHTIKASKEVVLAAGVIQSPQLLELSGIGDPEVLKAAGIHVRVENKSVGANFQDHVLGGMLYDLAEGVNSMDSLHGAEYAKAQEEIYRKTGKGAYGSPGMLMGFVSYASLVDKETLERTIAEVREHSTAKTAFEKAQEEVIVKQLSDPTFANIQTFCECHVCSFSAKRDSNLQAFHVNWTSAQATLKLPSSPRHQRGRIASAFSYVWSTLCLEGAYTSLPPTHSKNHESTLATSSTPLTPKSSPKASSGWKKSLRNRYWRKASASAFYHLRVSRLRPRNKGPSTLGTTSPRSIIS